MWHTITLSGCQFISAIAYAAFLRAVKDYAKYITSKAPDESKKLKRNISISFKTGNESVYDAVVKLLPVYISNSKCYATFYFDLRHIAPRLCLRYRTTLIRNSHKARIDYRPMDKRRSIAIERPDVDPKDGIELIEYYKWLMISA